jgi:hypothetical protein
MMGGSLDQSKTVLAKMQEQLQKQTDQMLGAFGIKNNS